MIGGGVGVGRILTLESRIGVMVTHHLELFGSATGVVSLSPAGGSDVRLFMVGARLFFDRLFVEGQLGGVRTSEMCFDDCADTSDLTVAQVGIGIDLVHKNHVGFDLHLNDTLADGDSAVTLGVGVSFYLF